MEVHNEKILVMLHTTYALPPPPPLVYLGQQYCPRALIGFSNLYDKENAFLSSYFK